MRASLPNGARARKVAKAFEATCDCDVEFVSVADGVALLNRLRLEGGRTDADIVLGLDTNLTAEAKDSGFFAPHGLSTDALDIPGGWSDDTFIPFDYGYFAVIYDTEAIENPPTSMDDFLKGGKARSPSRIRAPRRRVSG
jgi:thiamine transport system substrate-binding protein